MMSSYYLLRHGVPDMGTSDHESLFPDGYIVVLVQELSYPPSILDLMVVCWSRDPNERPSANEIVSYASKPEFCSLLSSVAIGDGLEAICACCVSMATSDNISPHSSTEGKCYSAQLSVARTGNSKK